jgi:hypothetical protein
MSKNTRLLMISAMYENGGNTTHRFLDGHPELFVYPFESQIGTRFVNDSLTSTFPVKYRWPVFQLDATPREDYRAIIDEEGKVRARTPQVSKFRHMPFELSDEGRLEHYLRHVAGSGRSAADNVGAFFMATFDAWKDYRRSGSEKVYVGYSPVIVVDAGKILSQMPNAHVLHVVRNPWSAYADTKKRAVPLALETYMMCWSLNQYFALLNKKRYPDRMHILRLEDELADPAVALSSVLGAIGVAPGALKKFPSWNGEELKEVYPWGTIRKPTSEANQATAQELSPEERRDVRASAGPYLDVFAYEGFVD